LIDLGPRRSHSRLLLFLEIESVDCVVHQTVSGRNVFVRRGLPPSVRRVLRVQSDLVVSCSWQQTRRHHLRLGGFGLEMLRILMVLELLHVLLRFYQVFVHEVRLTEVV